MGESKKAGDQVSASSDQSSKIRKRALRRLARKHYDSYRDHYLRWEEEGYERTAARGRAWTELRRQYPDEYLELFALEQTAPGMTVSPQIRTKSWNRAMGLLTKLRKIPYREQYEQLLAEGHSMPDASYRAAAALREANPDLFTELLAGEIRMWTKHANTGEK